MSTPTAARKSLRIASLTSSVEKESTASASTPSSPSPQKARKSFRGNRVSSTSVSTLLTTQPINISTPVPTSQDATQPLSLPGCSRDFSGNSGSDTDAADPSCPVASTSRGPVNRTLLFSPENSDEDTPQDNLGKRGVETDESRSSSDDSFVDTQDKSPQKVKAPVSRTTRGTAASAKVKPVTKKAKLDVSTPSNRTRVQPSLQISSDKSLASKCVSYILVADHKKQAIKKTDILKHVFEGHDNKLFPSVLTAVKNILMRSFGFNLVDLPSRKNEYILVNALDRSLKVQNFADHSPLESQNRAFIFYILTTIFMNGNKIEEEVLWKSLKPLGIEIPSKIPHPVFGDVRKFVIDTLVKKMYLERICVCRDPEQFELFWGKRAEAEVLKKDCLKFACDIFETEKKEWVDQFKEIELDDEDEAMDEEV